MEIGSKKAIDAIQGGDMPHLDGTEKSLTEKMQKLLAIKIEDEKRQRDLEEFMKKFKDLGKNEDGTAIKLRGQNGEFQISAGMVSSDSNAPADSDEGIEAVIEMQALSKKAFGNAVVSGGAPTEEGRQIMYKIGEIVGLNYEDKPQKSLDQTNPELAKKVNDIYDRVHEKYGLPPRPEAEAALGQKPSPMEFQIQGPVTMMGAK
jgi:hypothetical protein